MQPPSSFKSTNSVLARVSVIITNHNYAHFLKAAVESVLDQTFPAMELIVVDDASTDNSLAVLETYRNRLMVVRTGGWGQWRAAMAGFSRSFGNIIVFLDADDVLTPTALARHVGEFEADRQCVVSQGQMDLIDRHGRALSGSLFKRRWMSGDLSSSLLLNGRLDHWPYTSGNAWRRDVVQAGLDFNPQIRNALDGFLHAIAPLFGTYRDCHTVVAHYRVHGKNMSLNEGLEKLSQSAFEESEKLRAITFFAQEGGVHFDPDVAISHSFKQIRIFLSWHLLGATAPSGLRPVNLTKAWRASLVPKFHLSWLRHLGWLVTVTCGWPSLKRWLCYRILTVIPQRVEANAKLSAKG